MEMGGMWAESKSKEADENIRSHKDDGIGVMMVLKGGWSQCQGSSSSSSGAEK